MAPKTAEKAIKAPAAKAPAAKKVVKKATKGASKKKTKAVESYKIYIYKVLKQVGSSSESGNSKIAYEFATPSINHETSRLHIIVQLQLFERTSRFWQIYNMVT
jgi:hypothetical protein